MVFFAAFLAVFFAAFFAVFFAAFFTAFFAIGPSSPYKVASEKMARYIINDSERKKL